MDDATWRRAQRLVGASLGRPVACLLPQQRICFEWTVPEPARRWALRQAVRMISNVDAPTLVASYAIAMAWEANAMGVAKKILSAAKFLSPEAYDEALDHMEGLQYLAESLHKTKGPINDRTLAELARRVGCSRSFSVVWSALDRHAPRSWPTVSYTAACKIEEIAKRDGVWHLLPAVVQQTPACPREWLPVARAVAA